MAISPASPEAECQIPGARPRRRSRRHGRRISRWVIRVLLLAVALLTISTPALAATHATHAAHESTAASTARSAPAVRAADSPVTLTANLTPAAPQQPGGVCQVPGIGDIGGLVGLCTQGSSGIVGEPEQHLRALAAAA